MLTIFTTPKPFEGHIDVIQRNALFSWKALSGSPEILVIGDEPGAEEACDDLGLTYVADVERHLGMPLLESFLFTAEVHSSSDILALVNTDIILLDDFTHVVASLADEEEFLVIGQRTDIELTDYLDFRLPKCKPILRKYAGKSGGLHSVAGMDYFIYRRGMWWRGPEAPPFIVAGTTYDNWMVWAALQHAKVIDATQAILALHQNHTYRLKAIPPWKAYNRSLITDWSQLATIKEAHIRL